MKRNLLAVFLALTLVVAMVFVIAPSAKADGTIYKVVSDDPTATVTLNFADVEGKILDLNGHYVAVEVPADGTLSVIDTANRNKDGVTGAGKLIKSGDGKIAAVSQMPETDDDYSLMRYLAIENGDGTYSAHPFNLTISQLGLNTKQGAICLRASFMANNKVIELIDDHGFSVDGTDYTAEEKYPFVSNFIDAYADLIGSLEDATLDTQKTVRAYIVIGEEIIYSTYEAEITPREVLKGINKAGITPTETQRAAIEKLSESSHLSNLFTSFTGKECDHIGGKATCTAQAICIDCDAFYGEVDAENHSFPVSGSHDCTNGCGATSECEYDGNTCTICGKVNTPIMDVPALPAGTEVKQGWYFNEDAEGWVAGDGSSREWENGTIKFYKGSKNPLLWSDEDLSIDLTGVTMVRIRIKVENGTLSATAKLKLYFMTEGDTKPDTTNKVFKPEYAKAPVGEDGYYTFDIDCSKNSYWAGTLTRLQIDPVGDANATYYLDSVELLSSNNSGSGEEEEPSTNIPALPAGTEVKQGWYFDEKAEGWGGNTSTTREWQSDGTVKFFTTNGSSPILQKDSLSIDVSDVTMVRVRIKVENGTLTDTAKMKLNATVDGTIIKSNPLYNGTPIGADGYYTFDISVDWTGTLTKLQLDPAGDKAATYYLDSIELLSSAN